MKLPGDPDQQAYVLARRVLLDALDVFRLLQSVPTEILADGIHSLLANGVAAGVTEEAVAFLRTLFSGPSRKGCQMAALAVASLEPDETIAASCAVLTEDLLKEIDGP